MTTALCAVFRPGDMSQPNQDWPAWIEASCASLGIIGVPVGWLIKRVLGSVSRKDFKDYLEARDALSERRHSENLGRLDAIRNEVYASREKIAHLEGAISGSYRRPT